MRKTYDIVHDRKGPVWQAIDGQSNARKTLKLIADDLVKHGFTIDKQKADVISVLNSKGTVHTMKIMPVTPL